MKKLKSIIFVALFAGLLFSFGNPLKAEENKNTNTAVSVHENAELNTTIHELETLFVLMQERISLMHDLARYKWNAQITDQTLEQEKLISKHESTDVQNFLEAQNLAAQKVQEDDFELFRNQEVIQFESVKDYKSEIKPELNRLNKKMLLTIEELLTHTQAKSLPGFLKEISFYSFKNEGIDKEIYDIAVEPLFNQEDL